MLPSKATSHKKKHITTAEVKKQNAALAKQARLSTSVKLSNVAHVNQDVK